MRIAMVAFVVAISSPASGKELNLNQQLIVACHRLDVNGVVNALREGADVNARFGNGDRYVFTDPWSHGTPVAAKNWTPLIAVASASKYPDPPRPIENTTDDQAWARQQQKEIPVEQIEQRKQNGVAIACILLSHRVNVDEHDGYGATALYFAVHAKKLELAKLLLAYNANPNTKTDVYIDGPGDTTPLHGASWSSELVQLLIEKGADPNAKDTEGNTAFKRTQSPRDVRPSAP